MNEGLNYWRVERTIGAVVQVTHEHTHATWPLPSGPDVVSVQPISRNDYGTNAPFEYVRSVNKEETTMVASGSGPEPSVRNLRERALQIYAEAQQELREAAARRREAERRACAEHLADILEVSDGYIIVEDFHAECFPEIRFVATVDGLRFVFQTKDAYDRSIIVEAFLLPDASFVSELELCEYPISNRSRRISSLYDLGSLITNFEPNTDPGEDK